MSKEELHNFVLMADQNDDGDVSFPEFLMSVIPDEEIAKETFLHQAFSLLDFDEDGEITAKDLVRSLSFVDGMNRKMANTIIAKYDVDRDGCILYDDFRLMMQPTRSTGPLKGVRSYNRMAVNSFDNISPGNIRGVRANRRSSNSPVLSRGSARSNGSQGRLAYQ